MAEGLLLIVESFFPLLFHLFLLFYVGVFQTARKQACQVKKYVWKSLGNESSENPSHVVLFVIKPPHLNYFLLDNLTKLCSWTGKHWGFSNLMQLHHKAVVSTN